jgi:hypothetical protein
MARMLLCDACHKPITDDNPIIYKLFLAPAIPGKTKNTHGNYTGHADIGKCCATKYTSSIKWQKRKTNTESNNGKRHRPAADALAKGNFVPASQEV